MKLRYAMLVAAGMTLAAAGAARAADDSAMKKDPGANMDTGTGDKIDTSSGPSANPANRGDVNDNDTKAQKHHHRAWKKKASDQGTGSSTARDTMNQPSESEDSRQAPDASPDTKTNDDSSTKP